MATIKERIIQGLLAEGWQVWESSRAANECFRKQWSDGSFIYAWVGPGGSFRGTPRACNFTNSRPFSDNVRARYLTAGDAKLAAAKGKPNSDDLLKEIGL